jgi:hypothetical protein
MDLDAGEAVQAVQEPFLDGHVRAFAVLGGVPTGMIRYDNLTPGSDPGPARA